MTLSPTTRAVLHALVAVICPPEAAPLADAIVDHVALSLGAAPALMQKGLAAGALAYDVGAVLRYGRRARALTGERADTYFRSWEHGPTPAHVQFARALNQLVSMGCYEQPAMMERIGYRPAPWIAEVTHKRLSIYADEIADRAKAIVAPDPLRPHAQKRRA